MHARITEKVGEEKAQRDQLNYGREEHGEKFNQDNVTCE